MALLFLASLPSAPPVPPECPRPGEVASAGGVTTHVTCGGESRRPVRGPARLLYGLRLDVNRAPARSLEALPGIGPHLAQAIVAARPFGSLADVRRVPGMGPSRLARVAPYLEVGQEGLSEPGIGSLPGGNGEVPEGRR